MDSALPVRVPAQASLMIRIPGPVPRSRAVKRGAGLASGAQAWRGLRSPRPPAGPPAGRPGGQCGTAGGLPAPRRPAGGGMGGLPVPGRPAAAELDGGDPLRPATRPLPRLPSAHPASPSRADLRCAGRGWGAARAASGRAGRVAVQGAGAAGGQGRPPAGSARPAAHPGWGGPGAARASRRAIPTWNALVDGIRASPVVAPDETGWRVAGHRAWLWRSPARAWSSTASPKAAASTTPRRHSAPTTPGAGTRRVGALPPVRHRRPSDLPGAPAAPLP